MRSTKLPFLALLAMSVFRWIRPCHSWLTRSTTVSSSLSSITRSKLSTTHVPLLVSTRTTRLHSTSIEDDLTNSKMINLHTIPLEELEAILKSWGHPKYRAKQIWNWVRVQGVTDIDEMNNIPKKLKAQLKEYAAVGALELDCELISKDGTRKRAYRLADGQLIESVLMPYEDGRYTACISSQAGCAQGCVFCATGQMGFSRQLTPDEIFEQVARFSSELAAVDKQEQKEAKGSNSKVGKNHGRSTRLSNIVFMGMGEPLANYRNVKAATKRIHDELGIGHRKITISTVGIVPNIRKMAADLPQVRLAVSLHCANDDERSALLPANKRYGGLKELMEALQDYIQTTGKRVTLEWALIEGENDTPETAHQLGKLIHKWLRKDMVHINVIPLNPTGGYGGSPSGRKRVNAFCSILEDQYKVACTPRVRRGIDINAGCGQLKAEVEKRQRAEEAAAAAMAVEMEEPHTLGASESTKISITLEDDKNDVEDDDFWDDPTSEPMWDTEMEEIEINMDDDLDWEDYEYRTPEEKAEADRLIALVKGTTITSENFIVGASSDNKPS